MASSRAHASPMDWQWEKEGGPSDPSSPYAPQNIQRQLSFGGPPRKRHFGETVVTPVKDRQIGIALPSSEPFFFTPFQRPPNSAAFKTPRDIRSPDFNSDVGDSPAPNVAGMDSVMEDDETPVKPGSTALVKKEDAKEDKDATPNAKPAKKEAYGGMFGNFFLPSTKPHKFSDKVAKKVERRRRKNKGSDFWNNSGDSYDDDDEDSPFAPATALRVQKGNGAGDRTWAETHRDIPQVLSQYLQLLVNVLIASLGIYIVYLVVSTIQRDVGKKTEEFISKAQRQVDFCQAQWLKNRCSPETIVPAAEEDCMKWRICADADPYNTGRSQVSAETFAEIINRFVEPISYKAMAFCFILVFGCLFISNFAFGFFRAKMGGHPAPVMAAAAPRFVDFGGAAGVVHAYPTPAMFATPAKKKGRGRSRSPTKTPFFTARRVVKRVEEEDSEGEMPSPTVSRKRVGWR